METEIKGDRPRQFLKNKNNIKSSKSFSPSLEARYLEI